MEHYPSLAEGDGLENRKAAVMSCGGSNPSCSARMKLAVGYLV